MIFVTRHVYVELRPFSLYNVIMAGTAKRKWYRLDSSGYMYPMIRTKDVQSLFALSARLDKDIEPELLDRAVNETFKRYPYFKVKIKQGLFRYYFAENKKPFLTVPDSGRILEAINFKSNNGYPFRITYYKRTVRLEIYHAVADGRGAAEFLKTVLFVYLQYLYGEIPADETVITVGSEVADEESEDAYLRYSEGCTASRAAKIIPEKAISDKGEQLKRSGFGITTAAIDSEILRKKAKEYECSVSEYITAVVLLAIAELHGRNAGNKKLVGFIPVDLRKAFPTKSLRNFVTFAFSKIDPAKTEPTVAAYAAAVKRDLRAFLNDKELMSEKLSVTTLMSSHPILRFLPQAVKTVIVRSARAFGNSATQSIIVSNLGVVTLPEGAAKHVEEFAFYLNCNGRTPKNAAAVTYNGKCYLSFSRRTVNENVEARVFELLGADGIPLTVYSNGRTENGKFPTDGERFKKPAEKGFRYKKRLSELLLAAATIICFPLLIVGSLAVGTVGLVLRALSGKKVGFLDI